MSEGRGGIGDDVCRPQCKRFFCVAKRRGFFSLQKSALDCSSFAREQFFIASPPDFMSRPQQAILKTISDCRREGIFPPPFGALEVSNKTLISGVSVPYRGSRAGRWGKLPSHSLAHDRLGINVHHPPVSSSEGMIQG